MFKLVVFYALIAISVARPYLDDDDYETPLAYSSPLDHQVPIVTKFGGIIKNIPAAVFRQRQTILHGKHNLVRAVKNYVGPFVKAYSAAPLFPSYEGSAQLGYGDNEQYW